MYAQFLHKPKYTATSNQHIDSTPSGVFRVLASIEQTEREFSAAYSTIKTDNDTHCGTKINRFYLCSEHYMRALTPTPTSTLKSYYYDLNFSILSRK